MFFTCKGIKIAITNSRKSPNIRIQNNTLLNSLCKRKGRRKIRSYFEWNENENTISKKEFGDGTKTVLGETFIVLKTLIRNKIMV